MKRVVGVLLGSMRAGRVLDVANSFAVPFDEDEKDGSVWFLDHDYLESMYNMFRKVLPSRLDRLPTRHFDVSPSVLVRSLR